ncbi:MAG TPA: SDR family NAD(P)-dependent oxidoreductase [Alphaproteobacteria bacterium]|jgi:NAD(P)-dependent dehydrogenase (short-subunit alcohol dehydrogenase family)|nr:SDR family NAD(P)-dependent oxidoreductase [Alphaproteobacteria bacterium]
MRTFRGRVAVITGGASGIGLALARRLGAEGMRLVIADIDEAAMKSAQGELEAAGYEVLVHRTDVAKAEDIQALADASVKRFGSVNVLVNNAGVGGFQHFETTTAETWEWTIGVNLFGVVNGCRIFLPILEKQDEAHIVNVASVAGIYSYTYLHPYNAAKAAVVALTEGMWREFGAEKPNVGMSVVLPGSIATAITNDERNAPPGHISRADADPSLAEFRKMYTAGIAAGMSPAEVAELIAAGIRERQLHIFTHPEMKALVTMRAEDIAAGSGLRDMFGNRPA